MRLIVDVNLAPAWADRLRVFGHEAQHWSEVGALDATDSEILAWAAERDAVVLTCDLDFGAILAASRASAPSVVQIRSRDVLPGDLDVPVLARMFERRLRGYRAMGYEVG